MMESHSLGNVILSTVPSKGQLKEIFLFGCFGGQWRELEALFLKLHKGASESGSAHANPKCRRKTRWCDARGDPDVPIQRKVCLLQEKCAVGVGQRS